MSIHTRRGYTFEAEVGVGLEVAKYYHFKIPDSKAVGRVIPIKVPADYLYSFKGQQYTLEVKQTKKHRIPWANFRDHQIEWVMANPKSAAFIINFNNREFGAGKVNRTFFVTADNLKTFKKVWENSVPMSEFILHCRELERRTAKYHPEGSSAFIEYKHEKF